MSALPKNYDYTEAVLRAGQLSAKLSYAEAEARANLARALEAERLLANLGNTLDLDTWTLEQVSQADTSYFTGSREQILEDLKTWDEDQKIPVCLACGSPRVDWFERSGGTGVAGETITECGWRCQACGAVEDRTGEGRKAA